MRKSNDDLYPAATDRTVASANKGHKRAMHPCNKYAEKPPNFSLLASKYLSFGKYVAYGHNKKPRIDWTDFNATRELTKVLLEHDYGIKWWIPDGQLCPTVPNRANYIHWIEDLLSISPAPWHAENPSHIRGIDIGTGANCIYPLLGAAINGWHFVATDVTPVALEWAQRNVQDNPQFLDLIEVRRAGGSAGGMTVGFSKEEEINATSSCLITPAETPAVSHSEEAQELGIPRGYSLCTIPVLDSKEDVPVDEAGLSTRIRDEEIPPEIDQEILDPRRTAVLRDQPHHELSEEPSLATSDNVGKATGNEPLLVGVITESENFDFCMCNPPFFENMEEAGLNPRTACGGTPHEMVYPGGELAFIMQIVKDSLQLQNQIQWYTSMVGRKCNIKLLTTMLRANGVKMLRTTEFVQGRTSRWGIAWSFLPAQEQVAIIPGRLSGKSNISFMLEGVGRKCTAWDILQALADQLRFYGATITVDTALFSLTGIISAEVDDLHHINDISSRSKPGHNNIVPVSSDVTNKSGHTLSFRTSEVIAPLQHYLEYMQVIYMLHEMGWGQVFQQVPGTILIKASLGKTESPSGTFSLLFEQVELALKKQFLKTATRS